MTRALIAALIAAMSVVACGGPSSTPLGPTAADVAVQQQDLPSGMVKCDLTGDIQSFIDKEQTPDPTTSKTMSSDWDQAKKNGATSAYASIYTDSKAHCDSIKSSGADLGAATYKTALNFVIEFKDEKSAASGYRSDKTIFGFSASSLKSAVAGSVLEGTKTGLSQNSITLEQPIANQFFYIAVWQKKVFMVILAVLN